MKDILDGEGVVHSGLLEECRAVVEDEVDTSELLPSLDKDSGPCTEAKLGVVVLEAISVRGRGGSLFRGECSGDIGTFVLDLGGIWSGGHETTEGGAGGIVTTSEEEVTRTLRKEDHSASEDACPCKLDSDRRLR